MWGRGTTLLDNVSIIWLEVYGAGEGTNNRADTYLLLMLLKAAVEKGIRTLQALGDSKLLIDWENGCSQISNLNLNPILELILELKITLKKPPLHIYIQGIQYRSRSSLKGILNNARNITGKKKYLSNKDYWKNRYLREKL